MRRFTVAAASSFVKWPVSGTISSRAAGTCARHRVDPETGAGAYKISGGVNGGFATLGATALGTLLFAVVGLFQLYVALWLVYFLLAALTLLLILAYLEGWSNPFTEETKLIGIAGLVVAVGLAFLNNPLLLTVLGPAAMEFLIILFVLFLIQAFITFVLSSWVPREETTRLAGRKLLYVST